MPKIRAWKKRFEKDAKVLKTPQELKLYQLPNITSDDVKKMLDSIVPSLNSGPANHSMQDVVGDGARHPRSVNQTCLAYTNDALPYPLP